MKVIDALGVACPGPVVAAKKELEEGKKEGFQGEMYVGRTVDSR